MTDTKLGFGGFSTVGRPVAGFEAMAMIGKGQIRRIVENDIRAQRRFIAGLFKIAAEFDRLSPLR